MGEKQEIGAKLTLDDAASETLHKVREGFEHVKERAAETGKEFLNMAKQAATFAIGFQLNGMIESVKEFGEEIIDAGSELETTQKQLAGVIGMVERGETSFEELSNDAKELDERFAVLAVGTGNMKSTLIDAFEMIGERSNRTADQVEDMVGKMAEASKALPGGLNSLSLAWRDLETGIIRPKNALVQLMRQMGVVDGTAKTVAKGLTAMIQSGQQDKVFDMAERAIEKMAEKTRNMPLTFQQIMVGLKGLRDEVFETLGTPITKALGREFEQLRNYLDTNRDHMLELAHTMGERVGEWATKAAELVKEGFQYLNDHGTELMDSLESGAKALHDAVAFMVEHRALFLALAGAKLMGSGLGAAAEALPGIGAAAGGMAGKAINALKGGNAFGMTASSLGMSASEAALAGITASVAAIAVAAGVWYVAVKEADQLEQETGLSIEQVIGHIASFQGNLFESANNMLNFNATQRAFHTTTAHSIEDLEHFEKQMERSGFAAVRAGDMTMDAFSHAMQEINGQIATRKHFESFESNMKDMASTAAGSTAVFGAKEGLNPLAVAYRKAAEDNAQEAERAAREILAANQQLVNALGGTGVEEALKKLKALAEKTVSGNDAKLPPLNFGPSTFHIVQDLRGADADAVVLELRRDITRTATSRVGSRLQTPFGI